MRCEVIKARDGLELPAYLSLPVSADVKLSGGLPMVLNVHGGPWARDAWGFRPDTQWFANRGYAVLQVSGKLHVFTCCLVDHVWVFRCIKAEDTQTLMCKLAACLCSRCKTGNPSAWSSALCSVFCHALGPAAHTQCFAFTRWFELCCNATAGLGSLLSRHMLPMFDGVGGSLLRALVTWHVDNPSRADVCFLRMTCSAWPCPSPA